MTPAGYWPHARMNGRILFFLQGKTKLICCSWRYGEATTTEVQKSRKWPQENVAPPGVRIIAVTSPDLLRAKWVEHRIELTASKTDFLFIPDTVAEGLSSPPNQQTTTQLEDVISKVLAVYDTKTSSKITGQNSCSEVSRSMSLTESIWAETCLHLCWLMSE